MPRGAATLTLESAGAKKIAVIKVVRQATRWGLKEAKGFVDRTPSQFKGIDADYARRLQSALEAAGARTSLELGGGRPTAPQAAGAPSDSLVTELERLTALHVSGALTDGEFAAAKAKILNPTA